MERITSLWFLFLLACVILAIRWASESEAYKGVMVIASESAGFKKVLSAGVFCRFFLVLLFDFDSQKE